MRKGKRHGTYMSNAKPEIQHRFEKRSCIFGSYCHTPKFALLLLKTFLISILKDFTRVDQINPLLGNQPKLGFGNSQIKVVPNISNGYHTSSYASKNLHVKFQALQVKFPQTIAQMVENQLYWTTSQLWSTYSQTS